MKTGLSQKAAIEIARSITDPKGVTYVCLSEGPLLLPYIISKEDWELTKDYRGPNNFISDLSEEEKIIFYSLVLAAEEYELEIFGDADIWLQDHNMFESHVISTALEE